MPKFAFYGSFLSQTNLGGVRGVIRTFTIQNKNDFIFLQSVLYFFLNQGRKGVRKGVRKEIWSQLLRLAHRTKKVEEVSDTPRFCIYFTKYDCTIHDIIIECASRMQNSG